MATHSEQHLNHLRSDDFATHAVTNQPAPLAPYDLFATDLPLRR
jgi:hypothetical protein